MVHTGNTLARKKKKTMMKRMRQATAVAAIAWVCAAASGVRVTAATITVGAGDDLQAALDRARPGDIVVLEPRATFTGNFVLPARDGSRPIIIRTGTPDSRLPGSTTRIGPEHADLLPKLKSPNTQPALRTTPGTKGWRLLGIEFVGNGQAGDVITLGDGSSAQRDRDELPQDLLLDRILLRGDPERGQKRGIALNSGATTIRNSYIADIKAMGQESQAIAGWNGSGPYVIENNFLEAAGVNILFGGADPAIPDLVPTDITIRRNHITKNVEWRGSKWTVKNLLELKNARTVLIEGNRLENCWTAAQPGYAVLFTVRNSGGRAPWAIIENVMFRNNMVSHSAGGINILGLDNTAPSQTANRITIQNNLFDDINHRRWGGNGVFLQIGGGAVNVTVDHNTIVHSGNIVTAYGSGNNRAMPGFRFTNNLAQHNAYGIFGNGVGVGTKAIDVYFPDGTIRANVIAGGQASRYPSGNFFPSVQQFLADFVNAANGDYRLNARSAYRRAGTDGADLGVLMDLLNRQLAGQDQ
ncbi:MAG TPA: hypothetical protein VFJ02_02495 [Vicinamibacterales bacterium]|nr:hypothetical protein [Vicinamibacterales bacterium]